MQEINWNNFKAKFNGKEQKSFEWLCYLLFCNEFKITKGIFRYKNQAGIETEPIEYDGKLIGFQAKFYETKISDNKEDIIDSIKKAKQKNPNLNKIVFYINQEFSEGKNKKEPKYETEITEYAKSFNIEMDWRCKSYFESPFVCKDNATIAQHFFSLDKSLIDFISELTQHTESILTRIHSKIVFNNNEIKIDRSPVIENLKAVLNKSPMVIISGEGGVGKTAVIKDFYNLSKEEAPFFVFKATEFNIPNINQLFTYYGHFTLLDFIKEHEDIEEKYLVIDSAEKLSDIEYMEVFQQFLSTLLGSKWKIIFTTRHSYLDDLRFQFVQVNNLKFQSLNINNLAIKELDELSNKHGFNLPDSERLLELLRNPFYLNKYLQNYKSLDSRASFSDFKNILWTEQISNSSYRKNNTHRKREECFLKIAQKRANEGHFFVKADDCDDEVLQKLEVDEVIEYESNSGGYFITHDIYEEWALDKIIERSFCNSANHKDFFRDIGSSLPIRRAFRNWLSEKLRDNKDKVKSLIEITIYDDEIESYWKDETYISVLLSDYSEIFFQLLESKLLEDDQKLLMRIVFLLRIACKEIDEGLLNLLGIPKRFSFALKTLFTKPKGSGWNCVIDFTHKHRREIGLQNIIIILPLLDDWNNENKSGDTTRKASQIGLYYYDEITNGDYWYSVHNEQKDQLMRVILQGASEIADELKVIFDDIISKKQANHRDRYYELVQNILTSITNNFEVIKCLPKYVIKLADLYWFQNPDEQSEEDFGYSEKMDIEDYFCISRSLLEYFPSSAFQTPIFQLLRYAPKNTIDFIVSFTNKCVECYVKSELKDEVEEVEACINEKESKKQYISNRLWNTYRGTQGSTHLLESMHMALEKWLLKSAESTSKADLESLCLNLISNSKSASITAVVASIVLAHPSKLFNIAKILFQTKEFFSYDTSRMMLDRYQKSQLLALKNNFPSSNYLNEIYQNERIKACDDSHRRNSLEHLALHYQLFRSEGETEDEVEERQSIMWEIFDKYYIKLPDKTIETEADKTWRLCLARMDSRKMSPEVEEKEGQMLVKFNPDVDPELKKFSEDSINKSSAAMKYVPLQIWSHYRFKGEEDKYQQYQQFETNHQLVISETREIIKGLKKKTKDSFLSLNYSIPAYTCSVLIRDFCDKLNSEEREFCRKSIIEYASIPLKVQRYHYQISDGTEPSIVILPELAKHFPKDKGEVKSLLLLLLINPYREISMFATRGILYSLWKINFDDAHSIFLGYLLLKPKHDCLRNEIRKENYQKGVYEISETQVLESFIKKYENELEKIVTNRITYAELGDLAKLDLKTLNTAFELLPLKTKNADHKKFLNVIFPIFSKKLFIDDDKVDYSLKHRFFEKFAYFILNSIKDEIAVYLKPFLDNFSNSRDMADFFQEFVSAEDRLNQYEEFWIVWNAFYGKIVEISKKGTHNHYTKGILNNYLLAWPYWKEEAREWHSLKDRERSFYSKVAEDMGHHPSVLYSISKILNDIGSKFIDEGIIWISNILQKNNELISEELQTNTVYYIENIMRRYILTNRQKVRTSKQIKDRIIVILNFLLERGSITGYLLREDIL